MVTARGGYFGAGKMTRRAAENFHPQQGKWEQAQNKCHNHRSSWAALLVTIWGVGGTVGGVSHIAHSHCRVNHS